MKLRLHVINVLFPLIALIVLYSLELGPLLLPQYVILGLILFTIGRAVLLLHQQTVFAILPVCLFTLPPSLGISLDLTLPYAQPLLMLYLLVVNLQVGQRPWFGAMHVLNVGLLLLMVLAAMGQLAALPIEPILAGPFPPLWVGLICVFPLLLVWRWQRMGRAAAFWPLFAMVPFVYEWVSREYLFLWMALACLWSLTLESYFMAFVDELTGIAGRRAMEFKLKTMPKHYFLAMLDVDHFKKFNDTHGHQVGDDVLRTVAKLIVGTQGARAYRYGGEEFALIFPAGAADEIAAALEETRETIAQYPLYPKSQQRDKQKRGKGSERKPLHVTVSFGLAQQHKGEAYQDVIKRADLALYQAKKKGRNRVEMAKKAANKGAFS
ncbi:diguanylate cyclase [Bermanella sp. R86510]|uniref:GGDEF domain-containing protein n=1 Tax=unclassified Bermanella TaxID=2627862 RepID=UPI0037C65403